MEQPLDKGRIDLITFSCSVEAFWSFNKTFKIKNPGWTGFRTSCEMVFQSFGLVACIECKNTKLNFLISRLVLGSWLKSKSASELLPLLIHCSV